MPVRFLSQASRALLRPWCHRRAFAFEQLETRHLLAAPASVLKDINPTPIVEGSYPQQLVASGSYVYFVADGSVNSGLWRTDGTPEGTIFVKRLINIVNLTDVNGTLFFEASDGRSGRELWTSDGTTQGTTLVKDIRQGSANGVSLNGAAHLNGTLFFRGNDGTSGYELWKSDGTTAGTVLVKDIQPGTGGSSPVSMVNLNGSLYFVANDGINGNELWKSDGTAAGTVMVKNISPDSAGATISNMTAVGNTVFFSASSASTGVELWKSDGTDAGTVLVKDIRPGALGSSPSRFTNVNGTLFFRANDGTTGYELWKSNGELAGTVQVADIRVGADSSIPRNFININGTLFFQAFDGGTSGDKLFKSDGTPANTVVVRNSVVLGLPSNDISRFANLDGTLFFSGNYELWKSDGTTTGTILVKDINPALTSKPKYLTVLAGRVIFSANDGTRGEELWMSDGTSVGTVLLRDIVTGTETSNPAPVLERNGSFYFAANDGSLGAELWTSDGTPAGTVLLKDIKAGTQPSLPRDFMNFNGALYFTANDGTNGYELWRSDGTSAGTTMLLDINPGSGSAFTTRGVRYPLSTNAINANGTLFFTAYTPTSGLELWKTDGTAAGTAMVKDITPGSADTELFGSPIAIGNVIYFCANNGSRGYELWRSDGTVAGTFRLKDIEPGSLSSFVNLPTILNDQLFFVARTSQSGTELWRTDGTSAGTVMIKDIFPGTGSSDITDMEAINGRLYFNANDGVSGGELWTSDGTEAGTMLVRDINPGPGGSSIRYIRNVNGTILFRADDGIVGSELWKSDGTASGTSLLLDVRPGEDSSFVAAFKVLHDRLFFRANDGQSGLELWESDGTLAGTFLSSDVQVGYGNSTPFPLAESGDNILIMATTELYGKELYTIPINFVPSDISLSTNRVSEDAGEGTVVGTFSTSDRNTGDSHRYMLVSGEGSSDNSHFAVVGNVLKTSSAFALDGTNTYSIRVRTTDQAGKSFEKVIAIVVENAAPLVAQDLPVIAGYTLTTVFNTGTFRDIAQDTVTLSVSLGTIVRTANGTWSWSYLPTTALFNQTVTVTATDEDGGSASTVFVVTALKAVAIDLPDATSNDILIRRDADRVQVIDLVQSQVLVSELLAEVALIRIKGSDSQIDKIAVDYAIGGLFALPEGIELDGQGSSLDELRVTGAVNSTARFTSLAIPAGFGQILSSDGVQSNSVRFGSFESLVFDGLKTFSPIGEIVVDYRKMAIDAEEPVELSEVTHLAGGSVASSSGFQLAAGREIRGWGTIITSATPSDPFNNRGALLGESPILPLIVSGYLDGDGALSNVLVQAILDSGSSVATSVSYGNVAYRGRLVVELGGTLAGSMYDHFNHTGTADLGGDLEVKLIGGFLPAVSQRFEFIQSSDSVIGSFSDLRLPTPPGNANWSIQYDSRSVSLELVELNLAISPGSMSEQGGAVTGTVSRSNTDISLPLIVTLSSSDTSEATVPSSVTIPAGQASITFVITAVDDALLDGTQPVVISASAQGYASVNQSLEVTDAESLGLSLSGSTMSEQGGTVTGTVSRSNTDISLPLTVTLSSSDTSEATVPSSVTIPAGQASITFAITAVDDALLDGTQPVVISASAQGYASVNQSLEVTDAESLGLSLSGSTMSEQGGTVTGTVSRSNTDISLPLTVTLSSSDTSEATVPSSVTIPAGQASITFVITAVDDALLDGTQPVVISASAQGYTSVTRSLEVTDAESLGLTLSVSSMSEQGGTVTGTASRSNTDISLPLTVTLSSSDTSEATVPSSVTIPAGQASITFAIMAVDDALLDGTQSVVISASAHGYTSVTRSLEVTDAESLGLSLSGSTMSEQGGTVTGTVSRSNTDISLPLIVTLSSSDTSEATVPSSVTIPAGQASITFAITAVDDALLDGTQPVVISASAQGYASVNQSLEVTDGESLGLSLSGSTMSEQGGTVTGTVSRSNTDISLPLIVTLSSSDTSEATVPSSVTIPAGQASITFAITAVDDALLDGAKSVVISASAQGYTSVTRSLEITDAESLGLTLNVSSMSEQGGTVTGTVSRSNTDISLPLTVTLSSSDTSEATVPSSVTIPAGQASITFAITAVDDALLDGAKSVVISASAQGYASVTRSLEVTDAESLGLSLSGSSMSEQGGTVTGTVSRSNTDISLPLIVTLSSSDTSEATVPSSVTIPAGQASITFAITAVDDALLDGTQSVVISASAQGYVSVNQSLEVTDAESLGLSLSGSTMSEQGGTVTGTVSRSNTDISLPLTVTLSSSDTSEATVPSSVTIPAGQASITFAITAVDDALLDGTQPVVTSASAQGYASVNQSLEVTDAESLGLTLSVSSMSEQGGTVTGTVSRSNTDIGLPLTVTLSSSDTSEATVPSSVTIPAGQASITFAITAVDDALLDGTQSVVISASAQGYVSVNQSLEVTDAESLGLSLSGSTMSEQGGTVTGTVSRSNTDISLPLTVTLSSSDTSEATVPSSVTIPAGQASITFAITAVDDTLLDGTQSAVISASAQGYTSVTRSLEVTDAESLVLSLSGSTMSEQGGTVTGTVARSNTDISLPLIVTLSSSDTSEATVPSSVTIPAGQALITFAITAVDDALLDGTQPVVTSASAQGYASVNQSLEVTDAESLGLSLSGSTMSEQGGTVTGTVSRSNTDISLPLTVTLSSSDTSEATVPSSVTIPAGQASITFAITAVDDALLDGTQPVVISASAQGYASVNQSLEVTDAESLGLSLSGSTMSEQGGTVTGTVSRSNTDISLPLTVTLSSSDTSEATVPSSVTIPAGQASITFVITAVDDALLDGTQVIVVSANATGYQSTSSNLDVVDNDRLFPWQNPRNPHDVNADGFVTPIDALLVINGINRGFRLPPELPIPFDPVEYLDVNGDAALSAIDALLVINALNNPEGERADNSRDQFCSMLVFAFAPDSEEIKRMKQ